MDNKIQKKKQPWTIFLLFKHNKTKNSKSSDRRVANCKKGKKDSGSQKIYLSLIYHLPPLVRWLWNSVAGHFFFLELANITRDVSINAILIASWDEKKLPAVESGNHFFGGVGGGGWHFEV